jgi:hypothetical protein
MPLLLFNHKLGTIGIKLAEALLRTRPHEDQMSCYRGAVRAYPGK